MRIKPKNSVELKKMAAASELAARTLDMITPHIKPGISTEKIDQLCHEFMIKHNAVPATLGYRGFPKSCCTSINDVICHGIPSEKDILKEGDIINVDVTAILDGYHGDTSRMYPVGDVSEENRLLMRTAYTCMMDAIDTVKSGSFLDEIGKTIQTKAEALGYGVVRDYCGHGLGRVFHEDPMVLHYYSGDPRQHIRLRKGSTFTIEPMINIGTFDGEVMEDDWTVRTKDRKNSAQYEHTIAVTEGGSDILTKSPEGYTDNLDL